MLLLKLQCLRNLTRQQGKPKEFLSGLCPVEEQDEDEVELDSTYVT